MPLINYSFTTPSNYAYDASKIAVDGGSAKLLLESAIGLILNNPINDDTGFVYDNSKVEFLAGTVQQKDQAPNGAVFATNFPTDVVTITNEADLLWRTDSGLLDAAITGAPSIVNGKLVCIGTDNGLSYQSVTTPLESHKFNYTPNYNITPNDNVNVFMCNPSIGGLGDRLILTHSPSGNSLRIGVYANSGTQVIGFATSIGVFSVIQNQEYEFELVVDSVAGEVYLFVNGILFYSNTSLTPWSRGGTNSSYYLGANPIVYNICDASYDDYIAFDNIQHTAPYSVGYTVPPLRFVEAIVDLPILQHGGLGVIQALNALSDSSTGLVRYTIGVDNTGLMYWNGLIWTISDGTYAQSNTLGSINANIATLPNVNLSTFVDIAIHFFDNNGPGLVVDDITVIYTGNTLYPIDNPKITPLVGVSQHSLMSFLVTSSIPGLDSIQYTLQVDGQEFYYNGSAWVNADGSYTQSNDVVILQANLSSFSAIGTILPVAYLHSDDGSSTPLIDNIGIQYDFYGGVALPENICVVHGYLFDALGVPVVGVSVTVTPTSFGITNDKLISRDPRTAVTDSTGYWEIKLVETQTGANNWGYKFEMPGYTSTRIVPNTPSAEFNNLALAVVI